jgi:hypothetical protein
MQATGKLLILAACVLAALGLLLILWEKIPFLGKLPGDITVRGNGTQIFFPITSSIVLSVVASLVLWAISHWRGK